MIAAPDNLRMRAYQHHVFPGQKSAHNRSLDLTMLGDSTHLQIVGYHQMLITKFVAQQVGDDVMAQRRRLKQSPCETFRDIDVWKSAMAHHHATHEQQQDPRVPG